jgi:hypothetical protein
MPVVTGYFHVLPKRARRFNSASAVAKQVARLGGNSATQLKLPFDTPHHVVEVFSNPSPPTPFLVITPSLEIPAASLEHAQQIAAALTGPVYIATPTEDITDL